MKLLGYKNEKRGIVPKMVFGDPNGTGPAEQSGHCRRQRKPKIGGGS